MRKWLAVIAVLAGVIGLTASGAKSDPLPNLIAKPGDLFWLKGTPKVCAVNQVSPRNRKLRKVTTVACWNRTAKGTPVPNGRILFIWGWQDQGENKSLAGYTSWNEKGTKFNRPAPTAIFTFDRGWPKKYKGDPFSVTKSQRLGRKVRVLAPDQNFVSLFSSSRQIKCGFSAPYEPYEENPPFMDCDDQPIKSVLTAEEENKYFVIAAAPWDDANAGVILYDVACDCGQWKAGRSLGFP